MQAIFMESLSDLKTRVIISLYFQKRMDIYFKYLNASSLPPKSFSLQEKPIIFTAVSNNF